MAKSRDTGAASKHHCHRSPPSMHRNHTPEKSLRRGQLLFAHTPPGVPSDIPPLPPDREPPDIILPPRTPPAESPDELPPPPPPQPDPPPAPARF